MTPTSVQLWERIHAAGLATPDECRNWAIAITKSAPPECLLDASKLAAELIRLGKISSFQANVLFRDLPIPLAIGPYRISESLESRLGSNWLQAIDSSRPKQTSLWCFLLTQQNLERPELQNWPPSLGLAEKQIAVTHPSLDKWLFSGIDKTSFVSFCEVLEGESLSSRLINRPLSWSESATMVEQIASGLQRLHDSGLVHGCICSDAIWCVDDGVFVLRRDPVFPPANPYSANSNSVLTSSRDVLLSIAAPELTLPNTVHSFQTDLYALGCVWYRSLTCNSPFGNELKDTAQSWALTHTTKAAIPLTPAELPEPLQRCLAHLLAKNPVSRFATASDLIKAIEVALVESEKQPTPITTPNNAIVEKSAVEKSATEKPASIPKVPAAAKPNVAKPADSVPATRSKPTPVPVPTASKEPVDVLPVAQVAPQPLKEPLPKDTQPKESVPKESVPETALSKIESARDEIPVSPVPKPKSSSVATGKKKPSVPKKNSGKKKSKKKKKPMWVLPALFGGACLVFGLIITLIVRNSGSSIPVPAKGNLASSNPPVENRNAATVPAVVQAAPGNNNSDISKKPTESVSEYFAVESDDGKLLWAPPQAGSPYSLEMFPAGIEAMAFVSGNMWHRRENARDLGKWWTESQTDLVQLLSKLPLLNDDRIGSVGIGLYPSKKPGVPQAAFRISFSQPVSIDSVISACPGFSLQLIDPKSKSKTGLWSNESASNAIAIAMDGMQTDGSTMIKRVLVGPEALIATLPELNGGPAPLRRQLETLIKTTDSRADLTLLFAPSFLFGDGRELLFTFPKLQEILRESIDESMQAVAFTTTVNSRWYMELRMLSSETRDAGKFEATLKASLSTVPDDFEKVLASGTGVHPYWRALGLRYPQMMRALIRYARFGLEDGQVVANAYLPTDALNNIVIASWMALQNFSTEAGPTVTVTRPPATKPPAKSMDEILESKITIGFEQESLEAALQLISGELSDSVLAGSPLSMSINGAAFQKEGITRNQSIRSFKHNSVALRIVLMDLVRRANPVTTVQSPTERNQKVVWLILDDPDRPGQKKIELTTRTWSEANKVALPKEFVAE